LKVQALAFCHWAICSSVANLRASRATVTVFDAGDGAATCTAAPASPPTDRWLRGADAASTFCPWRHRQFMSPRRNCRPTEPL